MLIAYVEFNAGIDRGNRELLHDYSRLLGHADGGTYRQQSERAE
jgi:hypothetical protein